MVKDDTNKGEREIRWGSGAIGVVGILLTLLAAYAFLVIFSPTPFEPPADAYMDYDVSFMHEALDPEQVASVVKHVDSFGSRFMGHPGSQKAYEFIKGAYKAAGLDVIELKDRAPAPVTEIRQITHVDGSLIDDVEIYPFFPNTYQPMVTPPGGLTGQVVLASRDLLQNIETLKGKIVVIDLYDTALQAVWQDYAALGALAVILTHRDGLEHVPWKRDDVFNFSSSMNPVNYVRLAANPAILNLQGSSVTLTVRTRWDNLEHRTLIGRQAAANPAAEALVITMDYDAYSLLPDLVNSPQSSLAIAVHLQILEGLQSYADTLRRDVYFVATGGSMSASAGKRQLLQFIGPHAERREVSRIWRDERADNQSQSERVQRIMDFLDQDGVLTDYESTEAAQVMLSTEDRRFLREQLRYTINTLALRQNDVVIRLRSVFDREGEGSIQSPAFQNFFAAQQRYNDIQARAGDRLLQLMAPGSDGRDSFFERYDIAPALRERFEDLSAFHASTSRQIEDGISIGAWFQDYRQIVVLDPRLAPASARLEGDDTDEALTFLAGGNLVAGRNDARFADLMQLMSFRLEHEQRPEIVTAIGRAGEHDNVLRGTLGDPLIVFSGSDLWARFGYAGFMMLHAGRKSVYDDVLSPIPEPIVPLKGSIDRSLAFCAEMTLTLAHGNANFDLPKRTELKTIDFTGSVLASGVGRSIVPNYPMQNALVGVQAPTRGRLSIPMGFSDVYGRYAFRISALPQVLSVWTPYSPLAVQFGDDGIIAFIKDIGPRGLRIYSSENISVLSRGRGGRDINIVLLRADPITVLDMINPQTMQAFVDVDAWRRVNLQPFDSFYKWRGDFVSLFVPPNERIYLIFRAGSPDNEALQTTRAFALGDMRGYTEESDAEIQGPGFLPEDTPIVTEMPLLSAHSMTDLNEKRLELQKQSGMADQLTLEFHERSRERLEAIDSESKSLHQRLLSSRDALTYAILNHPVVRRNVIEAVIGIVWYIGLLVPFVIFTEKLVFGFNDIRKQLLAHLIIFLVVFSLLRYLHPAFHMIRSSLMILLGFIIFLISSLVTVMISGRFKENLDEIRQKQARVKGADVNTTGVLATAFMLGLNNMHRRKVRTGLTCATLVLLTFVMISFTSVQSNVVARATAVGRAPYQGILVKNEDFMPIANSEVNALESKYGHRFILNRRFGYFGMVTGTRETLSPQIRARTIPESDNERRRQRMFTSVLLFEATEPLARSINLLTDRGWFTMEQQRDLESPAPVMLPLTAAEELQIRPQQVNEGGVYITLNDVRCEVVGIFDPESLSNLRDMDDYGLLPFDILGLQTIRTGPGNIVLADADSPLVTADLIILGLHGVFQGQVPVRGAQAPRLMSVAVEVPSEPRENRFGELLPANSYREARETVDAYLEQSGRPAYYGLDRYAFYGRRMRERSMGGLIDMLIPLIIAALTVVNTMRGSVYERRDEIFVYNAVGIAPRYVFFMFFAEAFVYSVMGSVLGYILSQGTGKFLTAMDWTGGLNMNFTSLSTVYASLTIVGAVFLSTWFPARSAMEIAAPAEDAGWDLPEPDGDQLSFMLPFTFDRHDRIAVLGFFYRYLADHGEGSAGPFFSGAPALGIAEHPDEHGDGGVVPQVSATIWLKPFDLGVSQLMTIDLPTDHETGEYIAHITLQRLSGTADAWNRLCKGYTARIRRHFLHWRAVSSDMKKSLYSEATAILRDSEGMHG